MSWSSASSAAAAPLPWVSTSSVLNPVAGQIGLCYLAGDRDGFGRGHRETAHLRPAIDVVICRSELRQQFRVSSFADRPAPEIAECSYPARGTLIGTPTATVRKVS